MTEDSPGAGSSADGLRLLSGSGRPRPHTGGLHVALSCPDSAAEGSSIMAWFASG